MQLRKTDDAVKAQYERFPYPPIGRWALPTSAPVAKLGLARLQCIAPAFSLSRNLPGAAKRVLVVGCGTLEPLLVARANPHCEEMVAIDLSASSIQRLRHRWRWARQLQQIKLWRHSSFQTELNAQVVDLFQYQGGDFDFVVASNVLHHTSDPAAALRHLAAQLKPKGVLRLVTYPKRSRFWLRLTGEWLRWHGIEQQTPNLVKNCRRVMASLPSEHPIRLCFETHREARRATGIVDAFLHALENPLAPREWETAARKAGLRLVAEDQHPLSQSNFLTQLLPEAKQLSAWDQLQILDDTLELSTNLVLWFVKEDKSESALTSLGMDPESRPMSSLATSPHVLSSTSSIEEVTCLTGAELSLPSQVFWELGTGLRDAAMCLAPVGVTVQELVERLRQEVGAHVSPDGKRTLPGFAVSDYNTEALLMAQPPWTTEQWDELSARGRWCLRFENQIVPGDSLAAQAQWLQLRYGFLQTTIPVRLSAY